MPQIEITLDQLKNFIGDISGFHKPVINRALYDVAGVLEETLENDVFTTHDDTVHIPDKDVLRSNIKTGGRSHNPPRTPIKGATYSPEYLDRKKKGGGFYKPHVFENFGFYHGIDIKVGQGNVIMEAKVPETAEDKGFDYMTHHEQRRSVLKLAFLRGWQKIINTIVKRFEKEAKA